MNKISNMVNSSHVAPVGCLRTVRMCKGLRKQDLSSKNPTHRSLLPSDLSTFVDQY